MKLLIDSMYSPEIAERLRYLGHEASTPRELGRHNLTDEYLIELGRADGWVIVTENAADFAKAADCAVLLVLKRWWPVGAVTTRMVDALDSWVAATPHPMKMAQWLDARFR